MTVRIIRTARSDLTDGYWFYEDQESGLGNYFLASIFKDLDRLARTAGVHRKVRATGGHRMKARRFPYLIYYRLSAETVEVTAIIDGRRSPDWIRRHLQRE